MSFKPQAMRPNCQGLVAVSRRPASPPVAPLPRARIHDWYWYWYWYSNSLVLIRLLPERGAPAGTPLHDWVLTPRHETESRPFSSLEVGSEGIS